MPVETFECHETAAEPIEASEEAVGIIEKLGLSGQQQLLAPPDEATRRDRCPYREMTADELFVYRTLCPNSSLLKDYKASPIPLRVLQIAAHATELGIFKALVVWDRESAAVPDPVLVGMKADPSASWREIPFILARWGSELEAFVVLLKKAVAIGRASRKSKLEALRAELDAHIASVDSLPDSEIVRKGTSTPFIHGT